MRRLSRFSLRTIIVTMAVAAVFFYAVRTHIESDQLKLKVTKQALRITAQECELQELRFAMNFKTLSSATN